MTINGKARMNNEITRLTNRQQLIIGCGLALLMIATRGLPIAGFELLPGASWAVFFLAGVYLRSVLAVPGFLALAVLIDGIAVGWAGVAAYCLTPAYALLAPAYASLWLAGRWYATRHQYRLRSLVPLAASALVGAAVCELFSSGGFYWLSGVFAQPDMGQFQSRELIYFPAYLGSLFIWICAAVVAHISVVSIRGLGYDAVAAKP